MKKYLFLSYLLLLVGGISLTSCGGDDEEIDNGIENNDGNENSGTGTSNLTGSINGHDYVDLGLSVKWATCNVGASSPESIGGYYGWGDPTGQKISYNYDYFPNSNPPSDIKNTKYDIAYNNWGSKWRMPTAKEFSELIRIYQYYDVENGVEGIRFVGSNGNSIFLPIGGYRDHNGKIGRSTWGLYWTSNISSEYKSCAYNLVFTKKDEYENGIITWVSDNLRCESLLVRPVTDYSGNMEGNSGDNDNTGGSTTYEKPDIGFYDFTATTKSLKVQYKIYNKDEAKVTSAKIYYGTSSNPTSSKTATVSGVLITANISGLKAGTTYYVKCVAMGKGGTTTTTTTRCITNY